MQLGGKAYTYFVLDDNVISANLSAFKTKKQTKNILNT